VAEAAGIKRVLIPGLAAVFSAFGVGFSDIGHRYELPLQAATDQALKSCVDELLQRARRGMFAEGFDWNECVVEKALQVSHGEKDDTRPLQNGHLPQGIPAGAQLSVALSVTRPIPRPVLSGHFGAKSTSAASKKQRRILHAGKFSEVPLYQAEEQRSGAAAQGLAVLEEAYYTSRIDPGWRFEFSDSGDILLTRA